MNEDTLKLCGEAVDLARRLLAERDAARVECSELRQSEETALEAYTIVCRERDTLREKVKSLTDLLADAEAKIETFNAALDTEVRR